MSALREYRCPGLSYPISRAQHLGRLARFYAGCRQCAFRDDTGTLSPAAVRRMEQTRPRGLPRSLVRGRYVAGTLTDDLTPGLLRRLGMALGRELQAGPRPVAQAPLVVVGGDGRPATLRPLALLTDALRWTGCHVADAGAVSAACLARAIDHLQAAGGVLVGNPLGRSETAGLRCWTAASEPAAFVGRWLESAEALAEGADRPTRTFGGLQTTAASQLYLDDLAEAFHGLRPLRLVVWSDSIPVRGYLRQLTARVACRPIEGPRSLDEIASAVVAEHAHFGVQLVEDGEICRIVDERGETVAPHRLVVLLAHWLRLKDPARSRLVVEQSLGPAVQEAIRRTGLPLAVDAPNPGPAGDGLAEAIARAGGLTGAAEADVPHAPPLLLAADAAGRFWFPGKHRAADGLQALTHLLVLLSQNDRRLSSVLDCCAG